MDKIYFQKNNWYYSDGTKIEFNHYKDAPVWKSPDGIIRLMNYVSKDKANEEIRKVYEVFKW